MAKRDLRLNFNNNVFTLHYKGQRDYLLNHVCMQITSVDRA